MDITKEIAQIKENFEKETVTILDGLTYSQPLLIQKIEFYTNSQYLNGMFDEMNRYKPFYNIVNFRVNVATKATDLDTKDIQVFSENPEHAVKSMIFSKEIKNWMRKNFFSKTLNNMGFTRVKYGGVLVKRVIKNGEIHLEIPEWKNLITDQIDIKNGIKIEKHYMTPIQLQKKKAVWNKAEENWEIVEKAVDAIDNVTSNSRICVLEVEGEFENEYLVGEDDDTYTLQKHFILCDKDENPICCLHSEELAESNYKYLPYLEASGRALGIGVVEDGFNAQFATNDMVLKQRDILELGAKTTLYTDSDTVENNVLSDTQVGDIIKVEKGDQIGVLNLMPGSFPALEQIKQAWDEQYSRVSSTFEAVTGETMPSGTPFRAIAIQNQEAQSTFNYRREEMGIFLNEIFTDWIIPFITKKLNRSHILASDFTDDELRKIDDAFAKYTAKQQVIDDLLNGKPTTMEEFTQNIQTLKEGLVQMGKRRFIEVPDGYFKDVQFKLDILTTGEQINKTAMFETISNMIAVISSNPAILQDPVLKALLSKAVELSGIGINIDAIAPAQPQPQQGTPTPLEISPELTPEQNVA